MGCPASLKYDEKAQVRYQRDTVLVYRNVFQICDYPGNVAGCADAEEGSGEEGTVAGSNID